MSLYLPPAIRTPAYAVDGDDPVTLRVDAVDDRELVARAQLADAVVVVVPGVERMPLIGKALGDYLDALGAGTEPTFEPYQDGEYELVLTDARRRLEARGQSLLSGLHAFRDWCGLAALVVVLAPHSCLVASLRMPLDPEQLF